MKTTLLTTMPRFGTALFAVFLNAALLLSISLLQVRAADVSPTPSDEKRPDLLQITATKPASPATLKPGEKLAVQIHYQNPGPNGVRIWTLPYTRRHPTWEEGFLEIGSEVYTNKSGDVIGGFQYDNPAVIDEVKVTMVDSKTREIIATASLPIRARWSEPDATAQIAPTMPIKVECRLLEMTSKQADYVEQTLMRWSVNPGAQGPELDQLLWGNAAKKLAELSGTAESGKRGVAEKMHEKKPLVPHGADAATWQGTPVYVGESLEFEATCGKNAVVCDLNLVFRKAEMHGAKLETMSYTSGLTTFNSLPVLMGRRDFGTKAEILVGRTTWAAPIAKEWPTNSPPWLHLRAQLFTLSQAMLGEAARLSDNPQKLAEWLKTHGTCQALVTTTSLSGSRMVLEDRDQEYFPMPGNLVQARTISGVMIEPEFILGTTPEKTHPGVAQHFLSIGKPFLAVGETSAMAIVQFCPPKDAFGAMLSPLAGRDIQVRMHEDVMIPAGSAIALPCTERHWKEGTNDPAGPDTFPKDVFVVLQPYWLGGTKPTATAAGSTPVSKKTPTPPATPAPAIQPPVGKTPK